MCLTATSPSFLRPPSQSCRALFCRVNSAYRILALIAGAIRMLYLLYPHTVTSCSVCPITLRVILRSPVRVLAVSVLPEFPVFVMGFQALYFLQQVHGILHRPNVAAIQGCLKSDGVVRGQGPHQVFFRRGCLEVYSKVCVSRLI